MLLVVGAVLPGALLTGIIVTRTLEQNRTVLENRLADTARVDAEALDREFNATIRVLQTLAQSPSLDAGDLKTFWPESQRAARTQPGWYAVILATPDSELQLHSEVPLGQPVSQMQDTALAQQLEVSRTPIVGRLAPGRNGKLQFPISVPVERQGQLLYVLTAVMAPESLAPVIKTQLPETQEWTRAIVDPGLLIAARSRGGTQFMGREITALGRAQILNPPARPFEGTSLEGEALYSSLARSAYGWTTAVSVPRAVLDGPARASIVASVSGGIVLVLGGLLAVLFVSRRVSFDFEAARDAAAALADGRTPPPSKPRVAEAKQVEASLRRAAQLLADRERERDEQLQRAVMAQAEAEEASRTKDRFLAVLGHELRNPLAPALTALELMKLRGGPTLQRERDVLERQIAYMTRLVDDLLDISRLTRGKVDLVRHRFEVRTAIDRADRHRPLQDLGQVVIDRVAQDRPAHRVVRAEGGEPLPSGQRKPSGSIGPAEQVVGAEEQLVDVGVRVAAIDEAFAPGAGGELALADRGALEIESREKAQSCGAVHTGHDGGLDQTKLGEIAPARHRVHAGECPDRLRGYVGGDRLLAREGPGRHNQGEPRQREGEAGQSDSATAARPVVRLVRR